MVLSRIIGDNPIFRISQYLFVGVSLGYAFVVVYHQVIRRLVVQPSTILPDPFGLVLPPSLVMVLVLVPFALGLLLIPRIVGRQTFSWTANIPLGLIFGVGSALALSGAMAGTLIPQMAGTVQISLQQPVLDIIGSVVLSLGVIFVLSYFYFTVPDRAGLQRVSMVSARLGRWLLIITFGFFLAGALLTYLTALSDRLEFLVNWVFQVLAFVGRLTS
ncbi:MAG: hypothetical protein HC884_17120 [Chloroflexaceae bacterium]|nr:hypothetical protein [Chloroflexaceae bacterium]